MPIRPPFHRIAVIAFGILFLCSEAFAQATQVLVCFDSGAATSLLGRRIQEEIGAVGYTVRSDISCSPKTSEEVKTLIESRLVQAVVAFDETTQNCTIWVWNSKTGQLIARQTGLSAPLDFQHSEIALRISELLRAAFVELDTAPISEKVSPSVSPIPGSDREAQAQAGAVGQRNATDRRTAEKEESLRPKTKSSEQDTSPPRNRSATPTGSTDRLRRFAAAVIEISGGASALSLDYPPVAHLIVTGYLQPRRFLGPALALFVPLFPLRIEKEEGTVKILKGILLLGARLSFHFVKDRIGLDLGAGVGLDVTFIRSDAATGLNGRNTATFAAIPYGSLGLNVQLSGRVGFVLSVLVGSDIPRTRVSIIDEPVITTSPIFLTGLLGIRVSI